MGVFSLFRRKAKDTDEAAVTASAPAAETEAEKSDEAEGSTEAAQPAAEATDESSESAAEGVDAAAEGVDAADAADDVEIPKQQTAEQAADNVTSEDARK